ncbi:MAG: DNA polymerase Y family protein [Pseudomonadota bacterium]
MGRVRQLPVCPRDERTTPAETRPVVKRQSADGQYGLPLSEASEPLKSPAPSPAERLFFAVYVPLLPLEAVAPRDNVSAVVEEQQSVYRVVHADPRAIEAGVMAGQTSQAALALVPGLNLETRSPLKEQQQLEQLAGWLEQFSSFVSMADCDLLLLEIAGSLKLFGGLKALRQQIVDGLKQLGFTVCLAIAPTPLAATWLARAGRRSCIRDNHHLVPTLRELPLDCLHWPVTVTDALRGIGVTTVGDCLRLPRDGFAKRFGVAHLLQLDRAVGLLPDPRDAWRSPERFVADFEMTEEQADRELLLAICDELLQSHERFLLKRQLGTQALTLAFYHLKSPATELAVGAVELSRSAAHWCGLLRLQFEQLSLPEPVIAVRLRGGDARPLATESAALSFGTQKSGAASYSMKQLAERLVARIGRESVSRLALRQDHRPQRASREHDVFAGTPIDKIDTSWVEGLRRPLWLLSRPERLPVRQGCPVHEGRLEFLSGPERFETGWWDADAIARDYFVVRTTAGLRLWVFRDRREPGAWYLHGLFG